MIEISPDHLARGAYVYVRQSTVDQLKHNHESRRRQTALAHSAGQMSLSLTTISAYPLVALPDQAFSDCWRQSVPGR
jgi:hypothetical protein